MMTVRKASLLALVGAVVLSVAALAGTSAGADSGEVEYSCTFGVGGEEFQGSATASFDTAIPDGLVVDVRDQVSLGPGTGTVTFPDGLTHLLRAGGVPAIGNDVIGDMELSVDGVSGAFWAPGITLLDTAVPAEGPMSVDVEFSAEYFTFSSRHSGTYSVVLSYFYLPIETPEPPGGDLYCAPVGGPVVIDTVVVAPGPTPTPQRPVEYSCTLEIIDYSEEGGGGQTLDGRTTASFDTAIPDGLVVEVGEKVPLEPFTGTITIPEAFLDLAGLDTLGGLPVSGSGSLTVVETGEQFETGFSFEATEVPAEGPVSVDVEGQVYRDWVDGARFQPKRPGRYTFVGGSFGIDLDGGVEPSVWMGCRPVNGPVAIDTLQAVDDVAPNATAVRPVLVQTDFADDGADVPPLMLVGVLAMIAAGLLGLARARAHRTSRRH